MLTLEERRKKAAKLSTNVEVELKFYDGEEVVDSVTFTFTRLPTPVLQKISDDASVEATAKVLQQGFSSNDPASTTLWKSAFQYAYKVLLCEQLAKHVEAWSLEDEVSQESVKSVFDVLTAADQRDLALGYEKAAASEKEEAEKN